MVALAAGLLFAFTFVLRLRVDEADAAILSLFCLPIALLAVRFGIAGGLAAAAFASVLVVTWELVDESAQLGVLGYGSRISTYLLLGLLVGLYSSRSAAALSAARTLEERLRRLAERDPLTDLYNRSRFEQEFERQIAHAKRYGTCGALLLIDLDHFKAVNDTYGHDVGDDVLRATAAVLQGTIRRSDTAFRLGGDEFAVLIAEADGEAASATAQRVLDAMRRHRPVTISGGASIGIVLFGGDAEVAAADQLLVAADIALADAKQAGRGQIVVYAGQTRAAVTWAGRVRAAVEDDRLVLFAQPIVDLMTGAPAYDELLLRMLDDRGEPLLPAAFLPTAERFGLTADLDRWVVERALALARDGHAVGVNVSAQSLADPAFLERLERHAHTRGDLQGIVFEVTETRAVEQLSVRAVGERLNNLGCRLAIDDFGTGIGSFSSFKHLPVDYLKIDIYFIRGALTNPTDERIIRSIGAIAHAFGVKSIAEGVEDQATLDRLRVWSVDYAQGFYLGRPAALPTAEKSGTLKP